MAENPLGRNYYVNRNILSLRSLVASFTKRISLKFDFIQIFHDFIHVHVYSPGQGQIAPRGQSFDDNRFHSFVASLHFFFFFFFFFS